MDKIKTYLQLKNEFEETYSRFRKAVEGYKELWEKFYYPTSGSHRGWPIWQDSGDVDITEIDGKLYYLVGIEVSCCGSYAYGTFRWCPEDVFNNPTKENLDILLGICIREDERLRLIEEARIEKEAVARQKEIEEREIKELQRLKEKYEGK